MVEVSSDGELARAAVRASDGGGPVSSSSERATSDVPGNVAAQQQSSSPSASISNGSPTPPTITSPITQQPSPNPRATPTSPNNATTPASSIQDDQNSVVEENCESRQETTHVSSDQQQPPPPQQRNSSSHENSSTRTNAAPPPLVKTRNLMPPTPANTSHNLIRQIGAVSERVATMANNASGAFDAGVQRLNQQRNGKIPSDNLMMSKSKQQLLQPPLRQPTAPAPVPAPHPHHRLNQLQHHQQQNHHPNLQALHPQQSYKNSIPPLQKPLRPSPIRPYTPEQHQNLSRDAISKPIIQQQQQRTTYQSELREYSIASSNHRSNTSSVPPQQQQQQQQRPSIHILDEISRKPTNNMTQAERTRNGASIQEVTRELSDLVRFPNNASRHNVVRPHEIRQHQQMQLEAAAEDVKRCSKEYDRAIHELKQAQDRLQHAQQVLDHHQSLAATTAALQVEQQQLQRQQEQHAALSQPTLANLLLSDPPQKRMRLEHSTPVSQHQQPGSHTSPTSAPPAPQHLISPQLPQQRNERGHSTDEVPIDLTSTPRPWQHVEWRTQQQQNNQTPPFSITLLTPAEASSMNVPVTTSSSSSTNHHHQQQQQQQHHHQQQQQMRQDSFYNAHMRHKLKYRPLVDPVSPPRVAPSEHSSSPPINRGANSDPDIIPIQSPRDRINASPQQERIRLLHPGGAVLHPRVVTNNHQPIIPPPRRQSKAHCLRCQRPSGYVCSSCKLATYCSTECQTQHWTEHEVECVRICHLAKNLTGRPQHPQ